MVAGISCGLVTGETDDDYLVLTDIQGLEDFFGDMDFKVTGTTEGITAIQMDIKIHGLTRPIVEEAIRRTREARLFIMEVMKGAIAEPRKEVGKYAPKIIRIQIDPAKIGDVVGQRGKTINAIIERTGVKIDITDEGAVSICGVDQKSMDEAANMVKIIATDFEAGQIFTGKVVSIKEFGAFVEFAPGKEGMVHISKICKERINRVEDVLTLGDKVKVICLGKDKMGRISFSMKDVPEEAYKIMRNHNITKDDMLNGDGLRVVLWVAGCNHCCPECQNPVTWDPNGGLPFGEAERKEIFAELDKDYVSGITFSGGDPLHPANITEVTAFAKEIRKRYPGKTIWLYTGFLWEEICKEEIVRYLDVCVDGEFEVDKKELSLKWKGSSNQRVIDVPKTLHEGKVVLHK